MDNFMLTQELVVGYHRRDGSSRRMMKVNIRKAYDLVKWDFLHVMLQCFGFSSRLINLIMECITIVGFSVFFNEELVGFFPSSRDLR